MKKVIALIVTLMLPAVMSCGDQTAEKQPTLQIETVRLQQGEFTEKVGGRQIRYLISGDGPTCMVVPNSWGMNIEGLRGILGNLEKQLTVVYFDPRGMGGSGPAETDDDLSMAAVRQDLEALRNHLGIERAHFIGWSNGGMNLFIYAAEHPEAVRSAIFVHSVASFADEYLEIPDDHPMKEVVEAQNAVYRQYQELMEELDASDMSEEEKNRRYTEFSIDVFFPAGLPNANRLRDLLKTAFAQTSFSVRHTRYKDPERAGGWDVRDRLSLVTAPVLLFYGARDQPLPEACRKINSNLPNATEIVLENSSHFGPLEEPDVFTRAVSEFLACQH